MKSVFLDNLDNRSTQFARNKKLEELLDELHKLLEPADREASRIFTSPNLPPLFLVGNPRSGTTFIMQLLNTTENFAVPTNLLSRFYYAPYIGAKIQLLLTDKDFDYKNELGDFNSKQEFSSNLGKTSGALAPSEFFHFWRRFLPNYDPQWLSPKEEKEIDAQGLISGIASIEAVFEKPVATKAIIMQYNLPKLYEIFPNSIFVFVQRDPQFIMQSIYLARKHFYNTLDIWWSVKPKEFPELQNMDVYQQIAGQVYYTEKALETGLSQIPSKNKLTVDYEEVCQSPDSFYKMLRDIYKKNGYELPENASLPNNFVPSNKIRIPNNEFKKLVTSYHLFSKAT